jgi:hypothetical protein
MFYDTPKIGSYVRPLRVRRFGEKQFLAGKLLLKTDRQPRILLDYKRF